MSDGMPFDRAALDERMGGDEVLAADVIRLFLEDCPARLAAIRAAVEARDADRLRSAAHALKGAAGYFEARRVVDVAAALESMGRGRTLGEAAAACARLEVAVSHLMAALQTSLDQAARVN